jgi:hypothetical protein
MGITLSHPKWELDFGRQEELLDWALPRLGVGRRRGPTPHPFSRPDSGHKIDRSGSLLHHQSKDKHAITFLRIFFKTNRGTGTGTGTRTGACPAAIITITTLLLCSG